MESLPEVRNIPPMPKVKPPKASEADLLEQILAAIQQQTAAINRLANLQEQLLIAIAEADGEQDAVPTRYMDGSLVR
ncbi:hypothetical protein [Azotobacter vinelandii]|uniref:hypothetical protein n=1 Tax=Azotobacter vinelandii TaxID=354 RepID=UPI0009243921|nr:hypothetical protein [Azotobacter vinelandii]SFY16520.1 hypothetical protein SAMN04244547_04270 [Azotobacter vinelandii]